jgi:hypothetical protein
MGTTGTMQNAMISTKLVWLDWWRIREDDTPKIIRYSLNPADHEDNHECTNAGIMPNSCIRGAIRGRPDPLYVNSIRPERR